MKIYQIYYQNEDGRFRQWASNAKAAELLERELLASGEAHGETVDITEIDFPEDKTRILNWLNSHCHADNG